MSFRPLRLLATASKEEGYATKKDIKSTWKRGRKKEERQREKKKMMKKMGMAGKPGKGKKGKKGKGGQKMPKSLPVGFDPTAAGFDIPGLPGMPGIPGLPR